MSIRVSPEVEALFKKTLHSGSYQSADELVREALHLLEEQNRFLDLHREDLREQIREGYESLRRGEGVDGEAVFDRLDAHLDALENSSGR